MNGEFCIEITEIQMCMMLCVVCIIVYSEYLHLFVRTSWEGRTVRLQHSSLRIWDCL